MLKESWRPILGYEGLYEVSSLGRGRSVERIIRLESKYGHPFNRPIAARILKTRLHSSGRLRFALSALGVVRDMFVHHAVASAFLDKPKGAVEINHKDLNFTNNRVSNLEWVTKSQNALHARENGRAPTAKLSREKVEEVRGLAKAGITAVAIAKKFNVKPPAIRRVLTGLTWIAVGESARKLRREILTAKKQSRELRHKTKHETNRAMLVEKKRRHAEQRHDIQSQIRRWKAEGVKFTAIAPMLGKQPKSVGRIARSPNLRRR